MSVMAADLSDPEAAERARMLRSWGIGVKPDLPPDRARAAATSRRRPLGLAPAPGDDPAESSPRGEDHYSPGFSFKDGVDEEVLNSAATVDLLYEGLDAAASMVDTVNRKLKARIVELETENARARALTAELKSKLHEVDFIVERLRIEGKGPPGAKGDRGRDGRDGPRGETGLRGEQGEPGKPAPAIAGWTIDTDNFTATPILSDGTMGAMLRLRPLFEAFADALNDADVAEEADAAAASRARTEQATQEAGAHLR
jgi:hypothetical protein